MIGGVGLRGGEGSFVLDDHVLIATRQWTVVQPIVSAFVGAIVRDFAARDDILQDVAVAVLESYHRYDAARPFQAWALGIARNHIRLYLRKQKRDLLTFDEQVIASLADTFDQSAEALRRLDSLQYCLGRLETKSRALLELRYVEDLKPTAIGERMQMAPNTVAKALQRIRDLLRECIGRHAATEGGR